MGLSEGGGRFSEGEGDPGGGGWVNEIDVSGSGLLEV